MVDEETIVFGERDRKTFETEFDANFIFNNKMGITLRARHYWSRVSYDVFYTLLENGELGSTPYKGVDEEGMKLHDDNFNAFNIDLVYTWRFAPESDLIFVWKNSLLDSGNDASLSYLDNIKALSSADRYNNFSLKAVFYIDYLYFKKIKQE